MNGVIALVGAGEYLPVMNEIDRYLLGLVKLNGHTPRVVCMPTAAGQEGDKSVDRWLGMGVKHFEALGADVTPARIIDDSSANASEWLPALENADLVYFSGGKPDYLHQTLQDSLAWNAIQKALKRGAIYAGCSAGAMILAQRVPNLRTAGLKSLPAFGLLPAKFVMPHFDRMRGAWSAYLFAVRRQLRGEEFILGVDENTALVGKLGGDWQVMGAGEAHLITREKDLRVKTGETIRM